MLLSETGIELVTTANVARLTGLTEDFCQECLINLSFAELIRETSSGFQTIGLQVKKLRPHSLTVLDDTLADMSPRPAVRLYTGEWRREPN